MTTPVTAETRNGTAATLTDTMLRKAVIRRFSGIRHGRLSLSDGETRLSFGEPDDICAVDTSVSVLDPDFYRSVALGGSLGAAEAYMTGLWDCEDLTSLIRLLIRNRHVLDEMETGMARLRAPLRRVMHWLNRNHLANSRRNIRAHYDLGNDFFRLFLDPTMMYSSAIFAHPAESLEAASVNKLERICRMLELGPGDQVVEIGTGWGGFALHAAGNYGCHVTTTTISDEQFRLARERVSAAGLEERVEVIRRDYRKLDGRYDKLVSIEMIEAVGHEYFDIFFRKCSDLLRPGGRMLLQAITIADQRYEHAKQSVDFIQRYIFPGGALPAVSTVADCLRRVTDMRITDLLDIGPHYAETLRRWRTRFTDNLARIRDMGFPEDFIRRWHYYFCYCEAGFEERVIGDVQMLMQKPLCRTGFPYAD